MCGSLSFLDKIWVSEYMYCRNASIAHVRRKISLALGVSDALKNKDI